MRVSQPLKMLHQDMEREGAECQKDGKQVGGKGIVVDDSQEPHMLRRGKCERPSGGREGLSRWTYPVGRLHQHCMQEDY